MRRHALLFLAAILALPAVLAPSALAQRWDWNEESSRAQLQSFDTFLHDHPWIGKRLWEKPGRVNDKDFLNDNKELRQWLEDHPAAAREFRDNPPEFMRRERNFQYYGADYDSEEGGRAQLARFDWFLDGHPGIRRDLMRRPGLVNNDDYLSDHKDLREFLRDHPEIREQLRDHPKDFIQREGRYDREDEGR